MSLVAIGPVRHRCAARVKSCVMERGLDFACVGTMKRIISRRTRTVVNIHVSNRHSLENIVFRGPSRISQGPDQRMGTFSSEQFREEAPGRPRYIGECTAPSSRVPLRMITVRVRIGVLIQTAVSGDVPLLGHWIKCIPGHFVLVK